MLSNYFTIAEASALTNQNKETLKKKCQRGAIDGAKKVAGLWIIPREYVHKDSLIRVGVYIDGANIFHGGKDEGWFVDYRKVNDFIRQKYDPVVTSYYDSFGYEKDRSGQLKVSKNGKLIPSRKQLDFFNFLQGLGFRIVKKPLKFIKGDQNKPKNNMDSYITLDIYKEMDSWDGLIIFSGDSDFERLLTELLANKKPVHIFSFSKRLSYELKTLAFSNPLVSFTKLDDLRYTLERIKQ